MSDLVIVAAGPPTREGGVDLFLELVAALSPRTPAGFVWVGERPRGTARRLDAEVDALGMAGRIEWRPRGAAPSGDGVVLAVTSRSAEAARLALSEAVDGTPVVGFSSDPAVAEVLDAGGSSTVPYPDVAALAERVLAAGGSSTR